MKTGTALKKGQVIELSLESAAFEGVAVGRYNGLVVFVKNGVPGDRIRVEVRRKKRRHAEAALLEILQGSPHRVEPRCRYFDSCGGCSWQNTDYAEQLEFKRVQVEQLLRRIGGLEVPEVAPMLAAPDQFFYRNKMEFSFGARRWLTRSEIDSGRPLQKDFALGLHIPGRFDRILDLETCYLQAPPSAQIVNWVRDFAKARGWSAHDPRRQQGFLRHLVIRNGQKTGELMVNLVTSRLDSSRVDRLARQLHRSFPQIDTFVHSVNATRSPVAAGDENVLWGSGQIRDRIGNAVFGIAPTTFFQPNTLQAERLFSLALDFAELREDELVYDLFCGIGCIGIFLADHVRRVVGIELAPRSVEAARHNAARNGIDNCVFQCLSSESALGHDFLQQHGRPEVVFLDPPRVGLNRETIAALIEVAPARVVYISCNPATQARDLAMMATTYRLRRVQPVDMFPHTRHIENVVLLQRR